MTDLTFSPDGRTLASRSYDGSIILWDSDTGAMLRRLPGIDWHGGRVLYSPDGKSIVYSDGQTLTIRDSTDGSLIGIQEDVASPWAFTPEGHLVANHQADDLLIIWDIGRRAVVQTLRHGLSDYYSAALSADGGMLAVTDMHNVELVDVTTGKTLHTLTVTEEQLRDDRLGAVDIEDLAFSSDGSIIAAVSFHAVRLWRTDTGEYIATRKSEAPNDFRFSLDPHSVAFSSDDEMVAIGWDDGSIDVRNDEQVVKRIAAHSTWVRCLAFSPDGSMLASGSSDHSVRFWDPRTGELVRPVCGYHHPVNSVVFAPGGGMLLSGHADGSVRLWNAKAGVLQGTADGSKSASCEIPILSAGKETGGPTAFREVEQFVSSHSLLALSPDGRMLAAGDKQDHYSSVAVNLWNLETGELVHTLLARHHNRSRRTGTLEYHNDGVTAVAFSPDGKTLAIGHDCFAATLWDVETGQLRRELAWETYAESVTSLAFSPDGRTLAVGIAYDSGVHIWDTQTGTETKTLTGHASNVESVAFSPDGAILASGSNDATTKLWNASTGDLLATLLLLPSGERTTNDWVAYTPQGYYAGSDAAEGFIGWQVGSEVLPGETYSSQFRCDSLADPLRQLRA